MNRIGRIASPKNAAVDAASCDVIWTSSTDNKDDDVDDDDDDDDDNNNAFYLSTTCLVNNLYKNGVEMV